jgi:hypothetical protein
MVKTILVGPDLAYGKEVLRALDDAKFPITAALWLLQKERDDDWQLVIATPLYDKFGPSISYGKLIDALSKKEPVSLFDLPVRLESARRPFIKALRKTFGRAVSVEGMRLGLRLIGGTWIDDGYVYRIKP